jgi:preprotein translocase subunit YajC
MRHFPNPGETMGQILIAQAQPDASPAPAPQGAPGGTTGTQQPPPQNVDGTNAIFGQVLMFAAILAVFWIILIRPQRRREQERLSMLDKLERNDRVMTSGGLYGTVHSVKDNVVILKVDEDKDVKVRVTKGSIVHKETEKDAEKKKPS